jgi:hypothetical protein
MSTAVSSTPSKPLTFLDSFVTGSFVLLSGPWVFVLA